MNHPRNNLSVTLSLNPLPLARQTILQGDPRRVAKLGPRRLEAGAGMAHISPLPILALQAGFAPGDPFHQSDGMEQTGARATA